MVAVTPAVVEGGGVSSILLMSAAEKGQGVQRSFLAGDDDSDGWLSSVDEGRKGSSIVEEEELRWSNKGEKWDRWKKGLASSPEFHR